MFFLVAKLYIFSFLLKFSKYQNEIVFNVSPFQGFNHCQMFHDPWTNLNVDEVTFDQSIGWISQNISIQWWCPCDLASLDTNVRTSDVARGRTTYWGNAPLFSDNVHLLKIFFLESFRLDEYQIFSIFQRKNAESK